MIAARQQVTREQFEAFVQQPEHAEHTFELIGGEIVAMPSNPYSSNIMMRLGRHVTAHVDDHQLGHVTGEQAGYVVLGEVYAPDMAFISFAKLPSLPAQGFCPVAPDLAVEVISPTDREHHLRIKISNYLAAGTTVWVIDPPTQTVEIHAPGRAVIILGVTDTLEGGSVLTGFSLPVKAIFPPQNSPSA